MNEKPLIWNWKIELLEKKNRSSGHRSRSKNLCIAFSIRLVSIASDVHPKVTALLYVLFPSVFIEVHKETGRMSTWISMEQSMNKNSFAFNKKSLKSNNYRLTNTVEKVLDGLEVITSDQISEDAGFYSCLSDFFLKKLNFWISNERFFVHTKVIIPIVWYW